MELPMLYIIPFYFFIWGCGDKAADSAKDTAAVHDTATPADTADTAAE